MQLNISVASFNGHWSVHATIHYSQTPILMTSRSMTSQLSTSRNLNSITLLSDTTIHARTMCFHQRPNENWTRSERRQLVTLTYIVSVREGEGQNLLLRETQNDANLEGIGDPTPQRTQFSAFTELAQLHSRNHNSTKLRNNTKNRHFTRQSEWGPLHKIMQSSPFDSPSL